MTIPASIATGGHATDAEIVDAQNAVNALLAMLSGQPGTTGTATQVLHGAAAGFAAVSLTADVTGVLPEANGGTNQSTYAQGDVLYASAANTLAKLAKGTSGQLLQIGATIPAWAGDTAWVAMTGSFTNSWADFGGVFQGCGYFKDAGGFVHLRGLMKSGTLNTAAFTLPSGYRPSNKLVFAQVANAGAADVLGTLDIDSAGVITPVAGGNTYFSLSGITFDTR